MTSRSVLPLLLAWAASAVPAMAEERDVRAEIDAVLASVERPGDVLVLRDALVRLGDGRIDVLLERLTSEAHPLRRAALVGALDKLPRDAVRTHLGRIARESADDRERIAALDLLSRVGGRAEVKLCLDLPGASPSGAPLDAAMRAALERALAGLCERDPETPRALAAAFHQVPPAVQTTVAEVIAERARDGTLTLLTGLLDGPSGQAVPLLLLSIADAAGRSDEVVDDLLALERVRGFLGHPDEQLAVLACLAVEKLRDHEAVPDLIVLLESSDPNLRRRAHAALSTLTGLRMSSEADAWIEWLDESLGWWEERAEPCRVALVSGTPAEAAAAVHEVARQRLFVHHVVQLLALALNRPEADLARSACRALGTIPEARARRALARLALHPDPELAELALAAIARHERARVPGAAASPIRFPSRSVTP